MAAPGHVSSDARAEIFDALLYWCYWFARRPERELMKTCCLVVLTLLPVALAFAQESKEEDIKNLTA
jgi:hypothetical protein